MSWVFAIAIFFVVWWIVLFAVLPFFAKPQGEHADEIVPGTVESAPVSVQIGRIAFWNTIAAIGVFAVIWTLIVLDPFALGQPPTSLPR